MKSEIINPWYPPRPQPTICHQDKETTLSLPALMPNKLLFYFVACYAPEGCLWYKNKNGQDDQVYKEVHSWNTL